MLEAAEILLHLSLSKCESSSDENHEALCMEGRNQKIRAKIQLSSELLISRDPGNKFEFLSSVPQ